MAEPITIVAAASAPGALTAATAEDGSTVPDDYWDSSKHPRAESGQANGGQFVEAGGEGKDAAGKAAQQNTAARANFLKLDGMSPADARKFLKGLSEKDLKDLTAIAYSAKTSNKKVVAARNAVAGEMGRRGIDVKKHGARGGGRPGAVRASAAVPSVTILPGGGGS